MFPFCTPPFLPAERATVVIIGGGICGVLVASFLQQDCRFKVVLVDRKSYHEYTPNIIHAHVTEPKEQPPSKTPATKFRLHVDTDAKSPKSSASVPTWQPLATMLPNVQVVCGKVRALTAEHVTVDYQDHAYDYLVIATGTRAPSSLKPASVTLAARQAEMQQERATLKTSASTVVVVGGGPSGVEMASEIKSHHPDKHVVLVSRSATLLPRVKSGTLHTKVSASLRALGVDFILNESVTNWEANMSALCTNTGRCVLSVLSLCARPFPSHGLHRFVGVFSCSFFGGGWGVVLVSFHTDCCSATECTGARAKHPTRSSCAPRLTTCWTPAASSKLCARCKSSAAPTFLRVATCACGTCSRKNACARRSRTQPPSRKTSWRWRRGATPKTTPLWTASWTPRFG